MAKFVRDDPELLLASEIGDLQPLNERTRLMRMLMVEHTELQEAVTLREPFHYCQLARTLLFLVTV